MIKYSIPFTDLDITGAREKRIEKEWHSRVGHNTKRKKKGNKKEQ